MLRGVLIGIAVLVLFACTDDDHDEFRDDVLSCEEAVAHLEACCPSLRVPSNACDFSYDHESGCGSTTISTVCPALPLAESAGIRRMSCEEVVRTGQCTRGATLRPRGTSTTTTEGSPSHTVGTEPCP